MADGEKFMKYVVIGILVIGAGIVAWRNFGPTVETRQTGEIVVPEQLSAAASLGKKAYDRNCAECHGSNASGTQKGPPLVHDYYNPGHHADGAFFAAVANGVRQHHWNFGNMPPQPQVSSDQTRMIVAYVRELQEANGIVYRSH
jgi:mono/diheme cytochrome c family protein